MARKLTGGYAPKHRKVPVVTIETTTVEPENEAQPETKNVNNKLVKKGGVQKKKIIKKKK